MSNIEETRELIAGLRGLGDVRAPEALAPQVLWRTGLADRWFTVESPLGIVFVAHNRAGISFVMPGHDIAEFEEAFHERVGRPLYRDDAPPPRLLANVRRQLAGERRRLAFDLRGLTTFERAVLEQTQRIPPGEVRPYAWVAAEIGHPKAVRAVGTALKHNPVPLLIPCHRVVRTDGTLGNYAWGGDKKRVLLQAEGLDVERCEALAEAGVRYYGSDSTHIYCYPTCRHARRVTERHRMLFRSAGEAQAAGYRPCKVCRPTATG